MERRPTPLRRTDYSTERFAGFLQDLKESFWGELQGQVQQTVKALLEVDSEQRMEEYLGLRWYERAPAGEERLESRNGYYVRDYVTPWGTLRFRVRRTRLRAFLPRMLRAFARRAPEVAELIRQAFLRGIPTRAVGRHLELIITDGCRGLAAALQTVYPQALQQRCWVHKMRNLCQAVRRRDHERVKSAAQQISRAPSLAEARQAFARFKCNWQTIYPALVRHLEKDLPELLNFFQFPRHLWKKLRTTNPSADGVLRGAATPVSTLELSTQKG